MCGNSLEFISRSGEASLNPAWNKQRGGEDEEQRYTDPQTNMLR